MPDANGTPPAIPLSGPEDDRIRAAIEAVGPSGADDYTIALTKHAEQYRTAVPALADLLSRSRIQAVAQRFQEQDLRAIERQHRFNNTSRYVRAAVFCAGTATALLLMAGVLRTELDAQAQDVLLVVATIGAIAAGALATMWIRQIREGRLLEQWMTQRAQAETTRLAYFERITSATDIAEPLLQLEYFRRYQLDVQRTYYRLRAAEHRGTADQALSRSSLGMAGGALAGGLAGVLGGTLHPAWTALAGLGIAGQAWSALVANAEATAQNRRNAERYDQAYLALDHIYERLDEVRIAVASGDRAVMREFVDAVHEQLSLEHRQWLEEINAAGKAVNRLEGLLAKYREAETSQGNPGVDE